VPEQLYCNGKVIFLYNALSPPAKQVVFCFGHLHFSEHEKLQYPQQDKSHNEKKTPVRSTTLQTGAFSSYFSTLKPAFFYDASCSGFEVPRLLICGPFSQT